MTWDAELIGKIVGGLAIAILSVSAWFQRRQGKASHDNVDGDTAGGKVEDRQDRVSDESACIDHQRETTVIQTRLTALEKRFEREMETARHTNEIQFGLIRDISNEFHELAGMIKEDIRRRNQDGM